MRPRAGAEREIASIVMLVSWAMFLGSVLFAYGVLRLTPESWDASWTSGFRVPAVCGLALLGIGLFPLHRMGLSRLLLALSRLTFSGLGCWIMMSLWNLVPRTEGGPVLLMAEGLLAILSLQAFIGSAQAWFRAPMRRAVPLDSWFLFASTVLVFIGLFAV